ncbi:unnamed protein product (macronuclear) [Paramecium tetraurelia]|uniref:TNFR-Cys domain-containing protein n=1 Tax=Paramecium tetraurelia TaxID=5888 RepID=A0BRT3_PARTE|nr:uncharacterized protein GSPATT00031481001 [Paramecium tetraurelia]CAK61250.1 unnamed protein product [Paramecium tetraurelia]|eukprot:XP_001428648.1 hypothetical protein (macronuclear) [Paramecium tetraurelia strain d4-2]
MLFFLISNLLAHTFAQIVYEELSEPSLSELFQTNVKQCSLQDKIDFYYIDQQQPNLNFQFKINEPHFAVEIYVDFYLLGEYTEKNVNIYLDTILIDQYQKQYKYPSPFCDDSVDSEIVTYSTSYSHFQQDLNLLIQLENTTDFILGVRNIQIVPKLCHESCTQCVGPKENQCRSCAIGTQLNRKTNQCVCPPDLPYFSIVQNQCLSKCDVSEYYDASSNKCALDKNIEQMQLFFWNTYDYTGWTIIENEIAQELQDKTYSGVIGLFSVDQTISYQFNNTNLFNSIRVRADIYIFQSLISPEIYIQVDKIKTNVKPLSNQTITGQKGYKLFHIDYIIDANANSNIKFSLKGDPNTKWGINQVVFNEQNCSPQCQECSTKSTCQSCKSGFLLYLGHCVESCPKYSQIYNENTCADVKENYPNADVIMRAYDDNIIANFLSKNVTTLASVKQSYFGTFYDGVRYFGGLQREPIQLYQKQFYSLPPHYQVIVQFNILTFELGNNVYPNTLELNQDNNTVLIIRSQQNQVQQISQQFAHQSNNLQLSLLSHQEDRSIFSFGISKVNVMISRCYPLCKSCFGPNESDCKEWIYDQNSNDFKKCKNGFIFDVQQQKCVLCPLGCQKCSDQQTCNECEANFIKQGNSCYCQSGRIDDFTLECLAYS